MFIPKLFAKIHRATVTKADLSYEGSITIDQTLVDLAGLKEFQQVHVYNVTSGERFETYVLLGEPDSGTIQINGAAAHKATQGDIVIIAAYTYLTPDEFDQQAPNLVFVDELNRPKTLKHHFTSQLLTV